MAVQSPVQSLSSRQKVSQGRDMFGESSRPVCPVTFGQQDQEIKISNRRHPVTSFPLSLFYFLTGQTGLMGQGKDSEGLGGLRGDWTGGGQTGQVQPWR